MPVTPLVPCVKILSYKTLHTCYYCSASFPFLGFLFCWQLYTSPKTSCMEYYDYRMKNPVGEVRNKSREDKSDKFPTSGGKGAQ